MKTHDIRIIGIRLPREITPGDDLVGTILDAVASQGQSMTSGDIIVVTQKIVSKAEGRVVRLDEVEPSPRALELADDRDPRHVEWILRESAHIVRVRPPLIITETRHGFVCASAGVDAYHDLIVVQVCAGNPVRRGPDVAFVRLIDGLASVPERRLVLSSGP